MKKKITVLLAIMALISVSVLVWAVSKKQNNVKKPAAAVKSKPWPTHVYDMGLLAKFNKAARKIGTTDNYTYSGILNVSDGSDSTLNIQGMSFLCAKKGNNCYFRFGETETLNAAGYCIYIHHAQKKVIVSVQKRLSAVEMPGLQSLATNMEGENYALKDEKDGSTETISLENNKHITCKAYRLTFDTVTLDAKRIYARLSNVANPLNMAKDKVIDMAFDAWSTHANLKQYLQVNEVIRKRNGRVELMEKYKGYELLTTLQD